MGGIGFNSYPRTPTSIRPFWIDEREPGAAVNFYGYRPSEAIAPKLETASTTTDDSERQEVLSTVFGIISRDQPVNFLTFSRGLSGYRQRVAGLPDDPGLSFGYDSQTWYFSEGGNGSPSVGGTFTDGASSDAKTLNPIRINDTSSAARVGLTIDGAYSIDDNNEIAPRLFQSITSEDKKTWTVRLQPNLEWGNNYGQVTAEDWVEYIRKVRQDPDNWAGDVNHSDWFRGGEPIPVEQTARLEFEVRLPSIDPFFPKKPILWGAWCLPTNIIDEYYPGTDLSEDQRTAAGDRLNEDPVIRNLEWTGNLGPYNFERWDRDSVFVASRNDEYYAANTVFDGDVPYWNENRIQVFGEQSTRLAALRSGSIDSTGLPPAQFEQFEQNPDVQTIKTPDPFCGMLVYNQRANGWEELRKQEVRQALSMGINKQVIAEQINRGLADMAFTHQPPYSNWFDNSKVTKFGGPDSYGTAQAQHMLDDALPDGYSFE
jgi:peptide/nickel transport system substrate-binding protein